MLLYLHIPFCDNICGYCNFNTFLGDKFKEFYLSALKKQLKFDLDRFKVKNFSLDSLFVGGGTPSVMNAKFYEDLLKDLKPYLKEDAELSIEANPDSANYLWLKEIKNLGFNRISFGIQSFDEKKLELLNRKHGFKKAYEAPINAYKAGFNNISIDLIYDTYLDTKELLFDDLKKAYSLPISHISAYSLTIEKKTPFYKKAFYKSNNEELTKDFILAINDKFAQYEVSSFGKISKHNSSYWNGDDYLGIGSGAVGFFKDKRFYTQKNLKKYINSPIKIEEEVLTKEDLRLEHIFLGLRSFLGIDKKRLSKKEKQRAEISLEEGLLDLKNHRYYNTNYLLSDEIALYLSTA